MPEDIHDILILGGGPAGLTAAIYSSRAHLKTLIIAGAPSGGQLTTTTDVENYPGFPEGIQGPQLIEDFKAQAIRFNSEHIEENATKVSGDAESGFTVKTDSGAEYKGKTVLVATGASPRKLGLESEAKFWGKGVSSCATCDGFFFKGKDVAVIGGGDTSMEESMFLTKYVNNVYVIVRGAEEEMKASKIMQKRAKENKKIQFIYNTDAKEVLGDKTVVGLRIMNNKTKEESEIKVQGMFLAIGYIPNTRFLEGFVDLGKGNYIEVTDNTKTSKEGVFVAGDVSDYRYRQAVTAAGLGCMAALDTEKYLAQKGGSAVSTVANYV